MAILIPLNDDIWGVIFTMLCGFERALLARTARRMWKIYKKYRYVLKIETHKLAKYHYFHVIAYWCNGNVENMRRFIIVSLIWGDIAIYAAATSSFTCAICDRYGMKRQNRCRGRDVHLAARYILPKIMVDVLGGDLRGSPMGQRIVQFRLFGYQMIEESDMTIRRAQNRHISFRD